MLRKKKGEKNFCKKVRIVFDEKMNLIREGVTFMSSMVEYCDTPHIRREKKQGTQSIPGGYDVYSTFI